MFDRTNCMFEYDGLPDTIPAPIFEYMLQIYGSVAIIEDNDNLYAMRCNFGGPPDPYYRPTQAVVANPALGLSKTYRVVNHLPPFNRQPWEEMPPCVRFLNDSQIQGLLPLFARYATQMAENDVSIRSSQINLRQQTLIVADSGPEIESANVYIANLEAGKLSSIQKRPFVDGIQVMNAQTGQSNAVMQLIELQQYLKASWYNEIGLNSNFNMKSQYISSEEINSSADIMLPLVDNMLISRQQAVEAVNNQFGTNISVRKNSAWEKKQIQSDIAIMLGSDNVEETTDESLVDYTEESVSEPAEETDTPNQEVDEQPESGPQDTTEEADTFDESQADTEESDTSEEIEMLEEPAIEVNINIEGDVQNIEVTEEEGEEIDDMSQATDDE